MQYTLVNTLDDTVLSESDTDLDAAADDGWAFGARVGFVPQNNVLLYGKVAYAERTFEFEVDGINDDEDFTGPGFGVGVEYLATENVSIRLEGMRYHYSTMSEGDVELDPVEQTVDLAAVIRFQDAAAEPKDQFWGAVWATLSRAHTGPRFAYGEW